MHSIVLIGAAEAAGEGPSRSRADHVDLREVGRISVATTAETLFLRAGRRMLSAAKAG